MLEIFNKGAAILSTNYWDSEQARQGYVFLSFNAGFARVLLPDAMKSQLPEMRSATMVILSHGPWSERAGANGWELLFEDGTDAPYCLHLSEEQSDRTLPAADQGGGFWLTVWTRGGEKLRLPAKFRRVAELPCLQPWVDH